MRKEERRRGDEGGDEAGFVVADCTRRMTEQTKATLGDRGHDA